MQKSRAREDVGTHMNKKGGERSGNVVLGDDRSADVFNRHINENPRTQPGVEEKNRKIEAQAVLRSHMFESKVGQYTTPPKPGA